MERKIILSLTNMEHIFLILSCLEAKDLGIGWKDSCHRAHQHSGAFWEEGRVQAVGE